MALDPSQVGRIQLSRASLQLAELRDTLEARAAAIPDAEFDPASGAPINSAGLWVSNLSLVADELGELLATLGRLGDSPASFRTAADDGPPVSVRQLRPRPLTWSPEPDREGSRLKDPARHWHARIWQEGKIWLWELAPGYDYGEVQTIEPQVPDGQRAASEACERVLALHGWPPVCLPSGVSPPRDPLVQI